MSLSRRLFIKRGALALAALGGPPMCVGRVAHGAARDDRGKVLIAVFQRGAVDGLSMLVPHAEPAYYDGRPNIAIARPTPGDAESAVDLDGAFGLHPAMVPLKPLWDEGRLAVLPACGSPAATRSHFDAQDYMESGTPGAKATPDGWLARALVARPAARHTAFRGVAMGPSLPRSLRGEAGALALPSVKDVELRSTRGPAPAGPDARRGFADLYGATRDALLHDTARETFGAMRMLRNARLETLTPARGVEYPRSRFGDHLRQVAQLIKADLGVEVAFVESAGWDTHVAQGGARGPLASRLGDLAQGLAALARDLGDRMADVVVITMSEFGRTVRENGGRGTDHGRGTTMLALGGAVRGGRIVGRWPGLDRERLVEGRDLAVTTDFRDLFAEVAIRHLGVAPDARLFPGYPVDAARFPGVLG